MPQTLYDKLMSAHKVLEQEGSTLIYIDRQLIHEVTSPQAFEGLNLAGRKIWRKQANLAVPDHNVPTTERSSGVSSIIDPISRLQVETLDKNCESFDIQEIQMNDIR
ncbi:MAG: 3-isopropylmalate dehydratase large subunit, partial [Thiotrichales bacterium]|nr:3-isopropylmalate dehydratase large subunit [Thiotrichales bacterium]